MALEGLVNVPGALATTAPQLKNRQHADQITNDRWEVYKDITKDQWEVHELNKRSYTADHAMYVVEDGEAIAALDQVVGTDREHDEINFLLNRKHMTYDGFGRGVALQYIARKPGINVESHIQDPQIVD